MTTTRSETKLASIDVGELQEDAVQQGVEDSLIAAPTTSTPVRAGRSPTKSPSRKKRSTSKRALVTEASATMNASSQAQQDATPAIDNESPPSHHDGVNSAQQATTASIYDRKKKNEGQGKGLKPRNENTSDDDRSHATDDDKDDIRGSSHDKIKKKSNKPRKEQELGNSRNENNNDNDNSTFANKIPESNDSAGAGSLSQAALLLSPREENSGAVSSTTIPATTPRNAIRVQWIPIEWRLRSVYLQLRISAQLAARMWS